MYKYILLLILTEPLSKLYAKNPHSRLPIVLVANQLGPLQFFPIDSIRIFKSKEMNNGKFEAIPIPFQIDEKDDYDDFILPEGKNQNQKNSNIYFDFHDELSFMAEDAGGSTPPDIWPKVKPSKVFEIKFQKKNEEFSVFAAIFASKKPPLSPKRYVNFDIQREEIVTSNYAYQFDNDNYLVIRGADIIKHKRKHKLILHSTFFISANVKYFLTFNINQKDIQSELDAYKKGAVRTIARVNFNYEFLKLNFDLGMYTEVSFFDNTIILPATIENPIEGEKSLNKGSLFTTVLRLKITQIK